MTRARRLWFQSRNSRQRTTRPPDQAPGRLFPNRRGGIALTTPARSSIIFNPNLGLAVAAPVAGRMASPTGKPPPPIKRTPAYQWEGSSMSSEIRPPVVSMPTAPACLPGWDMQDKDDDRKNTHLWIVNRSIEMVETLTGPQRAAASFLKDLTIAHVADLHQGIWDADFLAPYNDWLWGYHFYDPDDGSNFYSCEVFPDVCHQPALAWGTKCYNESLTAFEQNDTAQAVYKLGLALHFLTDVGQPMHATNFTNFDKVPGYHAAFEAYAMEWTDKANPGPIPYAQNIRSDAPGDYITAAARL